MAGMKANRTWQGVRMRRVMAGADPDDAARLVTLPAAWDDTAAAALAELAPGDGPVTLATAADAWIRPIAERALRAGLEDAAGRAAASHAAAAPWRADGVRLAAVKAVPLPGFVLNLASFHDPAQRLRCAGVCRGGGDRGHRADPGGAIRRADRRRHGRPCRTAGFARHRLWLGCLAGGRCARSPPSCAVGRKWLRARWPRLFGTVAPAPPDWPAPPVDTALPGLAEAAQRRSSGRRGSGRPAARRADGDRRTRGGGRAARRGDRRHRAGVLAAGRRPEG